MSLKRNLLANYLGQGWSAMMNLAFIPLYIHYLGMESYGLIGLFAVMQAWLGLLDIGMTPTLGREMARFTAGGHTPQTIRNLLRTLEILCAGLAASMCAMVWSGSGWLAVNWLRVEKLSTATVAEAIGVMAFVLALRFVEGIYRSALVGLQRQVLYNVLNAATTTLRSFGAVLVLAWWSPTIEAFFVWQLLTSALSTVLLALTVHRCLPAAPARAVFSTDSLREVWRFAGGMTAVALLAVLLTQVDKVLVSRLLPLETFAFYALASAVCSGLYFLVTPITTALFPRLVQLHSQADDSGLASTYHYGAQLVAVTAAPAALVLAVFSQDVVFAWSGNAALAVGVGPILSVMALGTLLNGLMYMPYQLQLAHGKTGLIARANVLAVILLVPALLAIVPRFGAIGASLVWLALNAGYVMALVPLMHRKILPSQASRWYLNDVAAPVAAAGTIVLLSWLVAPQTLQNRWHWAAFLTLCFLVALVSAVLAAPEIRSKMRHGLRAAARSANLATGEK